MSKIPHAKWIDEATAQTPAGTCRSMDEVRAGIDQLDREIVALLAERAGYIRQAARIKGRLQEIVDPARIEQVVTRVRALAAGRGLPPDLVESLYRLMIERFIALEKPEFDRLHGAPKG